MGHGDADPRPMAAANNCITCNLASCKPLTNPRLPDTGQRREMFFGDDLVRHGLSDMV
jgi:hypothetical protein